MEQYLGEKSILQPFQLQFIMMPLAFAVWIFYYAVIRYNCAAVHYDMHAGSLIWEFALVSILHLLVLSVSSSSWCLGRVAACNCGTPWAFLLPFVSVCRLIRL